MPKKCGHLNGKKLISAEEMMQKINMIKQVAPTLVVVARTDALGVEGMDDALRRARLYMEAGADGIFPEALRDERQFRQFGQLDGARLLANMTEFGKTPYYTADQFQQWGFHMVIYPVSSLRVAAKAYERVFTKIMEEGTQVDAVDDMQTRKELYDIIGYYDYEALDTHISKTVLEDD